MFSVPRSTREHHSFVKLGSLPSDFWASITPECRDCGKDVRGAATPDALAPLSAAPTVLSSLLTALSPPLCILADSSPLAPGTDPCISDPQGVLTLPTSFRITAQLPLPSLLSFLGGPVLPPPPPAPPPTPPHMHRHAAHSSETLLPPVLARPSPLPPCLCTCCSLVRSNLLCLPLPPPPRALWKPQFLLQRLLAPHGRFPPVALLGLPSGSHRQPFAGMARLHSGGVFDWPDSRETENLSARVTRAGQG